MILLSLVLKASLHLKDFLLFITFAALTTSILYTFHYLFYKDIEERDV
jgi:hypothetical protein